MSNVDTGAVRNLLTEIFPDEEEFEFFCDDYFKEVKFEAGISLKKRAHVLTQYCTENGLLDKLLTQLQKVNSAKFEERKTAIYGEAAAPVAPPPQEPAAPAPQPTTPTPAPVTPNGRPSVFISYSRRDLPFVTQLRQELTNRGISAWFDKENIEVGDQWATSIVEGIRDCKIFTLVLSPDSTASKNVRKEVDLAQRYNKQIVPVGWRTTEIPVAMEYQLAGIQWMEFKEVASQENFEALADVLRRLMGGATMAEASSNKAMAKESTIPALPQAEIAPAGPRQLGGLKKKQTVSPIAVGGAVISGVVTTFGLDISDQDFVNTELKWLFSATDNFLKIRRGDITRNQAVAVPIPSDAQRQPQANNQLLNTISDFDMQIWEGQIESSYKRIDTYLKNLNILLDQEAKKGEAGKGDVYLQNQIKSARTEIVKVLQEMAQLINQAYGVLVTSPNQLIELLG